MIRINLLEGARPSAEPKIKPAEGPSQQTFQAMVFGLSLLVLAVIVGSLYWYWNRQITNLTAKLAVEQAEAARLKAIQAENQRFAKQLEEIEKRIATIRSLEANRQGPVDLMKALSRTVNRTVGLYLMSATPQGSRLVLQGQSNSVNAIADFVTALRDSGSFKDIRLSQYFENDVEDRTSFKFNLDCVYEPTPAPATPTVGASSPASTPAPQPSRM